MVRVRRQKTRRPFARLASFAVAFLLFTASAFFYAQDSKPAVPPRGALEYLPPVPGIKLPTDMIQKAGGFDGGREQLPAPAPATGRGGLPAPDLLPSAVMKPAKPDVPAEKPNFEGGLVQATYRELSGRRDFVFVAKDKGSFAKPIGVLNWDTSDKQFVNGGLEKQFRTYCCEPLISVMPGQTYQFKFDPIDRPEYLNQANDDEGQAETVQRTRYIRELYGRYYADSISTKEHAAAAFQAALWELVSESAPQAETDTKYSLFNGTFRTAFAEAESVPEYVRISEGYLKSLKGDDRAFYENPMFDQLELVRLTGVAGDDTVAPQSQIALRARTDYAGASGGGLADSSALGSSPLLLTSAGGSGGAPFTGRGNSPLGSGGFPTAGGGGGGFGGGGSSTGSGTGTGSVIGDGSTTGSGTGGKGGSGGTNTDSGGGDGGGTGGGSTITPVPAPPAVLLAIAGVGVLASGQIFRRKKA